VLAFGRPDRRFSRSASGATASFTPGIYNRPQPAEAQAIVAGREDLMAVLRGVAAAHASLYILDRNVRMATVIGIVGAGGIGLELKGRFDMFNFGHVGTILLIIFITVFLLDQFSARLRSRVL
jgi:hypothetical protein